MKQEIENQVKRFVELSLEFSVSTDEVYDGFVEQVQQTIGYYVTGTGHCDSYNHLTANLTANTIAVKSKLEQYKEALAEDAARAERYEEYIDLQGKLRTYFASIENLSK